MTRYLIALSFALAGCSGVHVPELDSGAPITGDASLDTRYVGCDDVAAAYEAARARYGCSYDWPNCPLTISNEQCVMDFGQTVSCGHLDTIASRCSL